MSRISFLRVVAVALIAMAGQLLRAADDRVQEATVVKAGDGKTGDAKKSDQKTARDTSAEQMKCPMMAGLGGLSMAADSPVALLARVGELGLDIKQQRQLEEIEASARQQARKILTDKQWEQVKQAPQGRLSIAELARMGLKGKNTDGCCPMCMAMMQAKESKAREEKSDGCKCKAEDKAKSKAREEAREEKNDGCKCKAEDKAQAATVVKAGDGKITLDDKKARLEELKEGFPSR